MGHFTHYNKSGDTLRKFYCIKWKAFFYSIHAFSTEWIVQTRTVGNYH